MKTLNSTFYSAEKPGSFCSSIDKLRHSLRLQFPTGGNRISNLQIKQWLREQQVHTTHRSARKRYPRAPIVVRGIDDQWELDLVEMIPFSRYNKGFKYILTCIDVLSKHAWARPLKSKNASDTTSAFKNILLRSRRKPRALRTDRGKEFLNSQFLQNCTDKGILAFCANSEQNFRILYKQRTEGRCD
jgi:hypothetical protein